MWGEKGSIIEYGNDAGSNRIVPDNEGTVDVVAVDELEIGQIDFVKIDVEGFEYNVIKGMKNLLNQWRPIVYVEIFEENYDNVSKLLEECGYEMQKEVCGNYIYISKSKIC